VTPEGVVSDYAGSYYSSGYSGNGGPATAAQLSLPFGLAIDAEGNLYIADTNNNVVRVVNAETHIITNFAGNHTQGYTGNGGLATAAEMNNPEGVAVDALGNVFISDSGNNVVREVTPNGLITTIAGNHTSGYSGNGGQATAAEMDNPVGLALDASGNLYVAERFNNVIRMIAPDGIISTVAGDNTGGYSGDGSAATTAELNNPFDVAVDSSGNLYIADTGNNVVREVNAITGDISTVVGAYPGTSGSSVTAALRAPRNSIPIAA
jgi:sugar lactone lactonase YvrE